jgi:hypothetical protein
LIHAHPEQFTSTVENASYVFDDFDDIIFGGIGHLHVEQSLEFIHDLDDMLLLKFLRNER